MKSFLVGKSFPIAPITTQTTALANDQLLFPMRPPPPAPPPPSPLPPLPAVPPSPRARDIRTGRKIHPPGTRRPHRQRGRSQHESFPAMIQPIPSTTTTTTTAAAAAGIAALASECCMLLSREGSGYGGRGGHDVP